MNTPVTKKKGRSYLKNPLSAFGRKLTIKSTMLLFFLLCLAVAASAQLKVTISGTASTCLSNGTVTAAVSGSSGTVKYILLDGTGTQVKQQNDNNVFTGLAAGIYQVSVSDDVSTNVLSNKITITSSYQALQLTTTGITPMPQNQVYACTASTTEGYLYVAIKSGTGNGPYKVTLYDGTGTMLSDTLVIPAGTYYGNINNLQNGTYKIGVTDACNSYVESGTVTISYAKTISYPSTITNLIYNTPSYTRSTVVGCGQGFDFTTSFFNSYYAYKDTLYTFIEFPTGNNSDTSYRNGPNLHLKFPTTLTPADINGQTFKVWVRDPCTKVWSFANYKFPDGSMSATTYASSTATNNNCDSIIPFIKVTWANATNAAYNYCYNIRLKLFKNDAPGVTLKDTTLTGTQTINDYSFYHPTSSGDYTVTLTDGNGNTETQVVTVKAQAPQILTFTTNTAYADCSLTSMVYSSQAYNFLPNTTYPVTVRLLNTGTFPNAETAYQPVQILQAPAISNDWQNLFGKIPVPFTSPTYPSPNYYDTVKYEVTWPGCSRKDTSIVYLTAKKFKYKSAKFIDYSIAVGTGGCSANAANVTINYEVRDTTGAKVSAFSDFILRQLPTGNYTNSANGTYTFNNLAPGTYKFGIAPNTSGVIANWSATYQASTCEYWDTITVVVPKLNAPSVDVSKTYGIICAGQPANSGTLTIAAVGYGPFQYAIGPKGAGTFSANQSSNVFTTLTAGDYDIRLTDGCGSQVVQTVQVVNATDLAKIKISSVNNSLVGCSNDNVTLQLNVVGSVSNIVWTLPDNSTVNDVTSLSIPNFSAANTGTYNVAVQSAAGCPASANISMTLAKSFDLQVTSPTPICKGNTVDLTASAITAGSNNIVTWAAYTNATATTAVTNPATAAPVTTTTYYIKGLSPDACVAIKPITVTVNDKASLGTLAKPAAVCSGTALPLTTPTVTTNGSPLNGAGKWYLNNVEFDPATLVTTADNNKTLYYSVVTDCGTTQTNSVTITVNAANSFTLQTATGTDNQSMCTGTALTTTKYQLAGTATGVSVTGTFPTGVSGSYSGGVYTISGTPTSVGTYNYTLTSTGGTCTPATVSGIITVSGTPSIATTTLPATVCAGSSLALIAPVVTANGATVTDPHWELGTGTTRIDASTLMTYADNGKSLRYVITSTCGGSTITRTVGNITVKDIPVITITQPAAVCSGNTLTLPTPSITANGSNYTNAHWELDGIAVSTPLTVTSADAGKMLTYVVTADCGGNVASNKVAVAINPDVALTLTSTDKDATLCINTALTAITYSVTNGSAATVTGLPTGVTGTYNSTTKTVTISGTPTVNGTFTYTVNATGTCKADNKTGTITVNGVPTISTPVAPAAICAGNPFVLTTPTVATNGSSTSNAHWELNGTTITSATLMAYANNGQTLKYVLTAGCGNTISSSGVAVTVKDIPVITITQPAAVCSGSALALPTPTITANGSNYTNAHWELDGVTVSTPITVTAADAGKLLAYVVTADCGGNVASNKVAVAINPDVALTLTSTDKDETLCINTALTAITYSVTNGSGATVTGLPTGVTGTYNSTTKVVTISGTPTVNGTFTYTVNATGTCKADSKTGTIIVNGVPAIGAVTLPGAVCAGSSLTLTTPVVTTNGASVSDGHWELAGTRIDGTTLMAYGDNNKQLKYVISASCGAATVSAVAGNITVKDKPVITITQPAAVCTGSALTLPTPTITANGSATSNPHWELDGVAVTTPIVVTDADNGKLLAYVADAECGGKIYSNKVAVQVTANASISLESASADGTTCINVALPASITFKTANTSGTTVTGLPAGMAGVYDAGTSITTISGTPTESGTFNYIIVAGSGCLNGSLSGTIAVNPDASLKLASAKANATLCINRALTTNITYDAANATQVMVTGLPAGIAGTYNSSTKVFTISGTPTESGIFNYSVVATAVAGCKEATVTGTITVNPDATLTLTSASANTTVCINKAFSTDLTYAATNTASVAVTGLPGGITPNYNAATGVLTINGIPTESGTFNYLITATATNSCTNATLPGVVTVIPDATITLNGGNDNAKICVNTALGVITYKTTGATKADVTGLPNGVTGTFNKTTGIYTISGTPVESGTFNYIVTATASNSCKEATIAGTITVGTDATVQLTSASADAKLCINTSIADITYGGTNTSSISITGLPTGVTGVYDNVNNVFTISGTPAQSGSFTYKVIAASGCISGNAGGNITVVPDASMSLTSASANATICINNALASNITYKATNAINVVATGLPDGIAGNYDEATGTFMISGTPVISGVYNYTVTATADGGCKNVTMQGKITVNPDATLTIASGDGNPTLCVASTLPVIAFKATNATAVTVTGLPAGVSGSYTAVTGTFTISGAPSVNGTFKYTVVAAGTCNPAQYEGTITVTSDAALTLASASPDASLCINNVLTPIRFNAANTNKVSVTGLPAGLDGQYNAANGVFTISGTPTESGTFKYIALAASGCQAGSQEGIIVVKPDAALDLMSGQASATICIANALPAITYKATNANDVTVSGLPAGITGSYDVVNGVFTISGAPSVSGIFKYTVTATGECKDASLNGTLTINPDAALVLTSAKPDASLCINTALASISYKATNAKDVSVTGLPNGVTGVYDNTNGTVTITGTPTESGTFKYTVTASSECLSKSLNGTITVNPEAVLTLTSGSANASLCINEPLTTILYKAENTSGVTITGLPVGVTGVYDNVTGVFTISGTPSVSGIYKYTVTAQNNCRAKSLEGTITIGADVSLALNSASANSTLCINKTLAAISYKATNAKNVSVTGLPDGITGVFSDVTGIFTISGSPAQSGTFKYTVVAEGACQGSALEGTIIVNPDATITTNGAGKNAEVCVNTPIPSLSFTTANTTNATVSGLPAGVTGKYINGIFTISGTPKESGIFNYTVTATGMCEPANINGIITVNANDTLALTSDIATTKQTLCSNNAIATITYKTLHIKDVTITGLPAGTTGVYDQATGAVTISGVPTETGTFTYTVQTTQSTCISAPPMSGTITVKGKPVITAIAIPDAVCAGSALNLVTPTVSDNGDPVTAAGWLLNDVTFNPSTLLTEADNGKNLKYIATNICGTTPSNIVAITVKNKPVITTTAMAPVCAPNTIDLKTGITNYDANNYAYAFTDATGAPVANPSAVGAAGIYTVTAENKVSKCAADPQTLQVVINPKPVVNMVTLTPGEVCAPATVNIQSLITNYDAAKYTYSYTDQSGNAVAVPTAISASGNYNITATDNVNNTHCSSQPVMVTVTVHPQPVVTLANNGAVALCGNGATINLTSSIANYNTAKYNYIFIDGSGNILSDVSAISLPGTYTVKAIDNGTGCSSDKMTLTLTRYALPTVITTDPAAVYDPYTVDITAPAITVGSTSGLAFTYYDGSNQPVSNTAAQQISGPGNYTYYIQGTTAEGCKSNTAPVHVMIKDRPILSISSAEIMEGQTATLTVSLPAGVTIPDAIKVVLTDDRTASTIRVGDYTMPATVTIPANTGSITFNVNTWDNNVLDLDRVLVIMGNNNIYKITNGTVLIHDTTSLKPQNMVITIGRDTIYGSGTGAVTVSLPAGITTSYQIEVSTFPASGTTIKNGDYMMTGVVNIQPGNGSGVLSVSVLNTAAEDRILNLSGTSTGFIVKNGSVYIRKSRINVIPLVSDNGDGINDYLKIEGIDKYTSKMGGGNKVILFNRWEDVIYEGGNYDNAAIKFNGLGNKHGSGRVPDGVYFYVITIEVPDNDLAPGEAKTQTFKGYFRLQK